MFPLGDPASFDLSHSQLPGLFLLTVLSFSIFGSWSPAADKQLSGRFRQKEGLPRVGVGLRLILGTPWPLAAHEPWTTAGLLLQWEGGCGGLGAETNSL